MPTILSHAALPLAIGLALGSRVIPRRLLAAGVVGAMLPDLDVIGFKFGIPYASQFGHRGFSHSLVFALCLALAAATMSRHLRTTARGAFTFLFISVASHDLLDCLTNGGRGVALLWPFSPERFFAPVQPIRVSPIGLSRFVSGNGSAVLASELVWVWLPCMVAGLLLYAVRQRARR